MKKYGMIKTYFTRLLDAHIWRILKAKLSWIGSEGTLQEINAFDQAPCHLDANICPFGSVQRTTKSTIAELRAKVMQAFEMDDPQTEASRSAFLSFGQVIPSPLHANGWQDSCKDSQAMRLTVDIPFWRSQSPNHTIWGTNGQTIALLAKERCLLRILQGGCDWMGGGRSFVFDGPNRKPWVLNLWHDSFGAYMAWSCVLAFVLFCSCIVFAGWVRSGENLPAWPGHSRTVSEQQ